MHYSKAAIILSLSSAAFARPHPIEKRDFTSNGVLYVETTVIDYVTVTATAPSAGSTGASSGSSILGELLGGTSVLSGSSTSVAVAAATSSSVASTSAAAAPVASVVASVPAAPPSQPSSSEAPAPAAVASTPAADPAPPAATPTTISNAGTGGLTAAEIVKVAPSSSSCSGAPYAAECITADQAAPAISLSYSTYGVTSPAAQAAVLALMVFESGSFKYNAKHFPPTPGQGTRNMMSPSFVSEYATDLYGAAKVAAAGSPDAVLALVQDLNDSCGSGAWFLKTKCPGVLTQFASDPEGAWTAYNGPGCIGTTLTADRTAVWTAAKAALGVGA